MHVTKKVIGTLNKCYALSELTYEGRHCFLVAAEKQDPCYLFSEDGEKLSTVWEGPGGVMTMTPLPGGNGAFLATHKFYSPNDSAEAKIVIAEPRAGGDWTVRTLVDAPFVHRFGILERGGVRYLIVCCLKSGHACKEDWTKPGRVFAAVLPEDLSPFNEAHQLPLTELKSGMLKNHGYCLVREQDYDTALVTCEQGVFQFVPPETLGGDWEIRHLLGVPTSDAVLVDLDGDGQLELGCMSPFHGDRLDIYHLNAAGAYEKVWEYPEPCEFLHAIWAGALLNGPAWVVGHRKGRRNTMVIRYLPGTGYTAEVIDEDVGAANVLHFVNTAGQDVIVAANRETDQIAMYTFAN